jgi:hypothetical protein
VSDFRLIRIKRQRVDWTALELAEFYRVEAALLRGGYPC